MRLDCCCTFHIHNNLILASCVYYDAYFQVGYVLHYSNFRNLNYFRFEDELLEAMLAGDTHIDYTNYIVVHNHNDKLLVWTEAEVVEAEKHECFVASESHHNRQFQLMLGL